MLQAEEGERGLWGPQIPSGGLMARAQLSLADSQQHTLAPGPQPSQTEGGPRHRVWVPAGHGDLWLGPQGCLAG